MIGLGPVFFSLQRDAHDDAVGFAVVIRVFVPELVGHFLQAGVSSFAFQRFDLGKHIFPRVGPAVQAQCAAHEQVDIPSGVEFVVLHEGERVAVRVDLEAFGLLQRCVVAADRIPRAGHVEGRAVFDGFRGRAERFQHAQRRPAELVPERVRDLWNAATIANKAQLVARVIDGAGAVIRDQPVGHQVVDAGVQTDFIYAGQSGLFEGGVQRFHLGRDIAGGHEMRFVFKAELCDGDVQITGKHRHGDVTGL